MTKLYARALCFALLMLLFFSAFAQADIYPAYQDSSKHRYISSLHSPQPIDPEMSRVISDFVKTESLRFKRAIHPAFSHSDSLNQDPARRLQIEQNPYILLTPSLKEYRYEPAFRIESMPTPFNGYYHRNVFTVIKYDRFIRPENVSEQIRADTIWGVNSSFFDKDDLFSVYYCPPTGDLRMLGGNAFLQQLPEDAYPFDRAGNFDQDAMLMARTRLINHINRNTGHFAWAYFKQDSVLQKLYESGKVRHYNASETSHFFGPGSCRLISIPIPRFYTIEKVETHTHAKDWKITIPPEAWNRIEMVYYTNRPNSGWKFKKGFPCYEIKWVILNEPQCYEDILPQIRELGADELKKLQSDPEWLHYVFLY